MSSYYFRSFGPPHVVTYGRNECTNGHVGSQIVKYNSPNGSHTIWTCPTCHRIVRHDIPEVGPFEWTAPRVLVPDGLEGVEVVGGRAWKMPDVPDKRPPWARHKNRA